jgi:flagellar basal-body rod protein FlgC
MNFNQTFAISAAGMNLERSRVDVAALNLANVNTIQTAGAPGYRPMRVLAMHVGAFAQLLGPVNDAAPQANAAGSVVSIEPLDAAPRRVYEPGHPLADERGYVTYPAVDSATETMTIMSAMRSYEANVAAMNATRSMALKTLEIGG